MKNGNADNVEAWEEIEEADNTMTLFTVINQSLIINTIMVVKCILLWYGVHSIGRTNYSL